MTESNIRVELRHFQPKTTGGVPYRWKGDTPNTLLYYEGDPLGLVEVVDFFDVTGLVLNLESIDFTWSVGDNDQHLKQSLTEEIDFAGEAAVFVRDWLVNRPYSPLNMIEVRFTDLVCNKIIGDYLIKPQKISFCVYDDCNVKVTAVQNDTLFECISKTKISDNKNGFLNQNFRAYDYAVEKRPAIMTAVLICLAAPVFVTGIALLPITWIVNAILRIFRVTWDRPTFSDIQQMFFEMVGLGRDHAAAGVRDYTNNVCTICGVTVDTPNNFLYQQEILHDGVTIQNPYYWLDVFYAQTQKGRRDNDPNRYKLIDLNIPVIGLDSLLNDLAKVFNAKWYLTNDGKLRFLLKQSFANLDPVIDFDDETTVSENPLLKLCYDVTDKQQPLTASFGYQQDTIDLAANDSLLRYNSYASYDADGNPNPNLKGNIDHIVPFGATNFRDDGVTKDYLDEATNSPLVLLGALAVMLLAAIFITAGIGLLPSFGAINGGLVIAAGTALIIIAVGYFGASTILDLSYTDVIVMSQDVAALPKLLIRKVKTDGQQDNARAEDGGTGASKTPNLLFNPIPKTYDQVHDYNEEQPTAHLRNYPLFFDVRFKNNVYDICWSKTDSRVNAVTERETTVEFLACCDVLTALGVYNDTTIAIDRKFKFPQEVTGGTFVTNTARIETIRVNFMTRKVELKGTNFN